MKTQVNINGSQIDTNQIKSVKMYVRIVHYVNTDDINNVNQNMARHIVNFMRQVYLCEHPADELDLLDGKFTDAYTVVNTVSLNKYDSLRQLVAISIDFDNMLSLGYINYAEYSNNSLKMNRRQQLFLEDKQQRVIKRYSLSGYQLGGSNIEDALMLINKEEIPVRKIRQYDLDGRLIKEYEDDSIAVVSRQTGINSSNISKCLSHQQATAKGFIFRYSDDNTPINVERKSVTFRDGKDPKLKRVAKYDMEGNLLDVYDSMGDAAASVGGSQSNITFVCNGQRRSAYGFIWKYVTNEEIDK